MMLLIDGFESTANPTAIDRRYGETVLAGNFVAGRRGGTALEWDGEAGTLEMTHGLREDQAGAVAVGLAVHATAPTTGPLITLLKGGAEQIAAYVVAVTGGMQVQLRRGGSSLGSSPTLPLSTWAYVELKAYVHDIDGRAEIRVDQESVVTFSGDTKLSGVDDVSAIKINASGGTWKLDDLYVAGAKWESLELAGEIHAHELTLTGNGALNRFEPKGEALNVDAVDDSEADDAATHVGTSVAAQDLYKTSALDRTRITGGIVGIGGTQELRVTDVSAPTPIGWRGRLYDPDDVAYDSPHAEVTPASTSWREEANAWGESPGGYQIESQHIGSLQVGPEGVE